MRELWTGLLTEQAGLVDQMEREQRGRLATSAQLSGLVVNVRTQDQMRWLTVAAVMFAIAAVVIGVLQLSSCADPRRSESSAALGPSPVVTKVQITKDTSGFAGQVAFAAGSRPVRGPFAPGARIAAVEAFSRVAWRRPNPPSPGCRALSAGSAGLCQRWHNSRADRLAYVPITASATRPLGRNQTPTTATTAREHFCASGHAPSGSSARCGWPCGTSACRTRRAPNSAGRESGRRANRHRATAARSARRAAARP